MIEKHRIFTNGVESVVIDLLPPVSKAAALWLRRKQAILDRLLIEKPEIYVKTRIEFQKEYERRWEAHMIEKHRAQLRALDDESTALIAELFHVTDDFLIPALEQQGVVQADVVMALLRAPPDRGVIASAALGQLVRLIPATV